MLICWLGLRGSQAVLKRLPTSSPQPLFRVSFAIDGAKLLQKNESTKFVPSLHDNSFILHVHLTPYPFVWDHFWWFWTDIKLSLIVVNCFIGLWRVCVWFRFLSISKLSTLNFQLSTSRCTSENHLRLWGITILVSMLSCKMVHYASCAVILARAIRPTEPWTHDPHLHISSRFAVSCIFPPNLLLSRFS